MVQAQQIRYLLEHKQATVNDLAARFGCSRKTIGRIRDFERFDPDRVLSIQWSIFEGKVKIVYLPQSLESKREHLELILNL